MVWQKQLLDWYACTHVHTHIYYLHAQKPPLCSQYLLNAINAVASTMNRSLPRSGISWFWRVLALEYEINHKRSHPFPQHSPCNVVSGEREDLCIKICICKCKGDCEEPNHSNWNSCCVRCVKLLFLWRRGTFVLLPFLAQERPHSLQGSAESGAASLSHLCLEQRDRPHRDRHRFECGSSFTLPFPFLFYT